MAAVYEAKWAMHKITVTEQAVTYHVPGVGDKVYSRGSIVAMSRRHLMVSLFGMGGMDEVTITTQGGPEKLQIPPKIAKELMSVLGYA